MRARKFLVSLTFAGTVLASLVGGVGAAPSPNANCIGQQFAAGAQQEGNCQLVSEFARENRGIGQFIGEGASQNCGQ